MKSILPVMLIAATGSIAATKAQPFFHFHIKVNPASLPTSMIRFQRDD